MSEAALELPAVATALEADRNLQRDSPAFCVTPSGIEPGLRIAQNIKRCADLRCVPQVLGESRWGRESAVENARNRVNSGQMGPRWAPDFEPPEVHCWTARPSCFSGGAKRRLVRRSGGQRPRPPHGNARLAWNAPERRAGGGRSAGRWRSAPRSRGRRPGPAKSPARSGRAPGRPGSARGTARRRWLSAIARPRGRWTPPPRWPVLNLNRPNSPRNSRWTPLPRWPVLAATTTPLRLAGAPQFRPPAGSRWPSHAERPSRSQSAGATSQVAQAQVPAVVFLRSRRWPSRRRTTWPSASSTSRPLHLVAGFEVIFHGRFWVITEDS